MNRPTGSLLTRGPLLVQWQQGGPATTRRLPADPDPGPLEGYSARFDDRFDTMAGRQAFRRYLESLLLRKIDDGVVSVSSCRSTSGCTTHEGSSRILRLTTSRAARTILPFAPSPG